MRNVVFVVAGVAVIAVLVVAIAWLSLPPAEPNPLLDALRTP